MRVLLQRVSRASVDIAGDTVAEIGAGLLALVGVGRDDGPAEPDWLAEKVFHLRIFEDAGGKMNLSVREFGGEVLVVPNFTLFGDARKGRRPSWAGAATPAPCRQAGRGLRRCAGRPGDTCEAKRLSGAHAGGAGERWPRHHPPGHDPVRRTLPDTDRSDLPGALLRVLPRLHLGLWCP